MSYQSDRAWSDGFIPAIKRIVGPYLLETSSLEVDRRQAADLVVLTGRDLTIAARVRRPGYSDQFPYQFTIRAQRASGARTELQKIIDRWGDWFLYGHAISDVDIGRWMLIDLHSFRAARSRRIIPDDMCGMKKNIDGKTTFAWFDIRGFSRCREPILIGASFIVDEPSAPQAPPPTFKGTPQLDLFA